MHPAFAFHAGERAVQARAGESSIAARNAAVMSPTIISGARVFIEKQNMVATASMDAAGQLWASVLFGPQGFVSTPDGGAVLMRIGEHERDRDDPFWAHAAPGAPLGMLFIELSSRRRYRVNGAFARIAAHDVEIDVHEAYPNCPKYIQRRHLRGRDAPGADAPAALRGTQWTPALASIVRQADTLFVASASASGDLDASHRGGSPGFVQQVDAQTLRIPDFHGNSLFNTLGNLSVNPQCGIAILDFAGQRVLHLSGTARLQWDLGDPTGATGGTGRFWDFEVREWLLRPLHARLDWEHLEASPFLPVLHAGA